MTVEAQSGLTAAERDGRDAYQTYCMICHGSEGKGDGFNSYNIDPKPADLMTLTPGLSDDHIASVIRSGSSAVGQSPICPPTGPALGERRVQNIVAYLRKLSPATQATSETGPSAGQAP